MPMFRDNNIATRAGKAVGELCPTCGKKMRELKEAFQSGKPTPGMLGTGGASRAGKKIQNRQRRLEEALRKQGG